MLSVVPCSPVAALPLILKERMKLRFTGGFNLIWREVSVAVLTACVGPQLNALFSRLWETALLCPLPDCLVILILSTTIFHFLNLLSRIGISLILYNNYITGQKQIQGRLVESSDNNLRYVVLWNYINSFCSVIVVSSFL